MSDLDKQFEEAKENVVSLAERPNNATLLKLYALHNQATKGDVSGDAPGAFDLVAKKKYKAWEEVKGMSMEDAKKAYIDLVNELLNE